eukprot:8665460-Alexandrium_andersonii.AAC.1
MAFSSVGLRMTSQAAPESLIPEERGAMAQALNLAPSLRNLPALRLDRRAAAPHLRPRVASNDWLRKAVGSFGRRAAQPRDCWEG